MNLLKNLSREKANKYVETLALYSNDYSRWSHINKCLHFQRYYNIMQFIQLICIGLTAPYKNVPIVLHVRYNFYF